MARTKHERLRRAFVLLPLLLSLALGGCFQTTSDALKTAPTAARKQLPDVPADIRRCFNGALSVPPDRDLTTDEVEAAWKSDRVRALVWRKCGRRFVNWYDDLNSRWR